MKPILKYELENLGVSLAWERGIWPDDINDRKKIFEIIKGYYLDDVPGWTGKEKDRDLVIEKIKKTANI